LFHLFYYTQIGEISLTQNHYARYQNDVANTASQLVTQALCAERGLDYNQVMQAAQQAHINGIFQQEQMRQFSQMLTRHYGGNTFFGKLKELVSPSSGSFFPMGAPMGSPLGMPMMPMSPVPAMMPQVQGIPAPMSPAHVASVVSQQVTAPSPDTAQLQKEVDDLKQLLVSMQQVMQTAQTLQGTAPAGQAGQQPPIY
jgi:hypothetical protein